MSRLKTAYPIGTLYSALLLVTALPANADNTSTQFDLNKVTVAATRTEQKQADVASTVSVIDEETMENNVSGNIRDVIRYEPGVDVGSAGGDAQRFGAKGFNIRGMDENRVKIMVDGVDLPKSFTPAGNPFQRANRNYVDIDSLKRVEIVKGPASALYGSEALGGMVLFTTKDPADYLEDGENFGGDVKLRYADADNALSEHVTLAARRGKWESLLHFTHRDAEEIKNHDDSDVERDPQDYSSDNWLAKLQYQLNAQHRFGFTYENFASDTYTDVSTKLTAPYYSDFYYGDDTTERQRASLHHDWQTETGLFDSLRWQLDWQDSEEDQETHTMYGVAIPTYRIKDYSQQEELWQFAAQLNKTLDTHLITYGLEYETTDLTNSQDTLYPTDSGSNTYDRAVPLVEGTSYGFYLQDQISLNDGKWLITPGVRYDKFRAEPTIDSSYAPPAATEQDFDDHNSDKFTFRLGAVYKFTETTSGFAQYSQGFKAPDILDMYYSSERFYGPGFHYLTLPNPDLKPEESESYEVGVRVNGDNGNLEVAVFYNDYENFIEDVTTDPSHGGVSYDRVTQAQNIEEANIRGVEVRGSLWLDQTANAPEGTSLQVAIAYAKGTNEEDNLPLESIAPMNAVVGLGYDSPSETWGSSINVTLVESKDAKELNDPDNYSTPGYGLLDITFYYNIIPDLTLRAGLFNLTDKKYWVYEDVRGRPSDDPDIDKYTQPGRNASASLIYSF